MSENALWRFRLYMVSLIGTFAWLFPPVALLMWHTIQTIVWVGAWLIPLGTAVTILIRAFVCIERPSVDDVKPIALKTAKNLFESFVSLPGACMSLSWMICMVYPQIDPRTTALAAAIIALEILIFIAAQIIESFLIPIPPPAAIPQAVQA